VVIQYKLGQAKHLAKRKFVGESHDDVRGSLDADDGGRTGPSYDLRD